MLKRIQSFERTLTRILNFLAIVFICLSTTLACVSVILRFGFSLSFDLVEEICRYLVVGSVLLLFGPLVISNAHLAMNLISDRLPTKWRRALDIVLFLLSAVVLMIALVGSCDWVLGLYDMGLQSMSGIIPSWLPSTTLPLGIGLAIVYALLGVIYTCAGVRMQSPGVKE